MSNEAEAYLIGGVFLKPDTFLEIDLKPTDFLNDNHSQIWAAMLEMKAKSQFVDLATTLDYLDAKFGETHLTRIVITLANETPSAANWERYQEVILRDSLSNKLSCMGREITLIADEFGPFDEKLGKALDLINQFNNSEEKTAKAIGEGLGAYIDELQRRTEIEFDGISTGFKHLDERFKGIKPADLVILAARPAMGKTSLALNIADHNAINNKNVLVFSLEMPEQQLIDKSMASTGRINLEALKAGLKAGYKHGYDPTEDRANLTSAMVLLKDKKLFIDDNGYQTVNSISIKCKRHQVKHGPLDLVVVDYLQLISSETKENRTNQIGEMSRKLKLLAKELNCPVICLSQLNRDLEKRPNKRPQMSDLRDSGAIEQDADIIMFIYRDEVYNPTNTGSLGVAEVGIAKFRNGEIGTDYLSANLGLSRFSDLAPNYNYQPHEEKTNNKRGFA